MIEKLVDLYYTDKWEEIAVHTANQLIERCFQASQRSVQPELWNLLKNGWFHDAYLIGFGCEQTKDIYTLHMSIKKKVCETKEVILNFSNITKLKINGNILDKDAIFPYSRGNKPIAQILDIWIEEADELICCILFDNDRNICVNCRKVESALSVICK